MGFTVRGDKNSLALLSSKRVKAYSRTRADEAFALPSFSDAMPAPTTEPPCTSNTAAKTQPEHCAEPKHRAEPEQRAEHVSENVKQTMLQHESVFKEQASLFFLAEPEHRAEHDSENMKQTMLQHESVFKEQLHELHRLYQKQRVLMVETQKGHAFHPHSEPPSSNSSFLYNPDSFKPQEDGSFGDASVAKAFDNDACPTQMVDVKPFEVDAEHQKQGYRCPMIDLERPVEGRPMFDLEHPADVRPMFDLERPPDDLPIIDLERPAEEYMDVELGKEKPRAMGSTCTLADASVFVTGENRDLVSGKNGDLWGRKNLDFCTSYGRREADGMFKDAFGSKERMGEGYTQPGDLGRQFKGDRWSAMGLSTKTLDCSGQDFFSRPVEAASASGLFRGLPDLNGECSAENQTSLVQRKPEKNVNTCQYIDLEADSRAPNGTSKLPHWLVQPPPKASRMSGPTNFPVQTSEWQQMTTFFSPQVHDKSKAEIMKTSNLQEPYHPWSHSKTNSLQREISFKEPLSLPSLQFFSGANTGAGQGSYEVAHTTSRLANESIPSFLPYIRDNDKKGLSTASGVLSSHSMDRQDVVFDTRATSVELISRISSIETTALSPVLPWYQQKESFSSLMHQASNPEPPLHRPSLVSSVNPRGATASHRVLGMHSFGGNFEGPCPVTRPESLTKDPVYDFLSSNSEHGLTRDLGMMKGNAATTWKQVERPFYTGQVAEKTTSSNNDCNLIPSRRVFDLNVSSELCPMEENFDACHFTESTCHANQKQGIKQECETISSSDWDILRGNKVPLVNEQQKGSDLQAPGFADRVTNKLMASKVSTKDATQSPNDITFFSRAGTFCSQRERHGNDTCADNCSGEDETGGGFVEVKSSDASGLTSCESRDAAHLDSTKVRDDNTSSGEACQSSESRIPCHKEDVALSSNVQSKRSSGLPLAKANGLVESQQWGSFLYSATQSAPGFDTKGDCSVLICTEFGDESEAANSIARKHSMETAEVAEFLLSLGSDLPPVAEEGYAINNQEKCLDWLANIIPQEENCEEQVLDVDMAGTAMHEDGSTQLASMGVAEKIMDDFEMAVLALKPISPDSECLTIKVMERGSLVENCSSLPTLRRRSSRRGRAGKDFQREMLRSMSSLSRHEITEDLQIIEGLIKSTTEAMNSCSLFPEDKPLSSPDSGSQRKARGTKACRGRKPNGTLNVCSWGESTRRKRMGRQRSQWSCLPSGVPFVNNTDDGASLM